MRPEPSEPNWLPIILVQCRIDGRSVIGELEVRAPPPPAYDQADAPDPLKVRFAA